VNEIADGSGDGRAATVSRCVETFAMLVAVVMTLLVCAVLGSYAVMYASSWSPSK